MSEPEIARRCSKCGASIREAAFFCPQCGAELKRGEPRPPTNPVSSEGDEIISEGAAAAPNNSNPELGSETLIEKRDESKKASRSGSELGSETLIEKRDRSKKKSDPTPDFGSQTLIERRDDSKKESRITSELEAQDPEPKIEKEAGVKATAPEAARASRAQAARGAVGTQIHRATTMARDVEGDVMHRARKVREISGVVLDEAGDDPSLRFVLVAAALFLLFLVIVVMNRIIN